MNIKNYLFKDIKRPGYYVMAGSTVLALVALIIYFAEGLNGSSLVNDYSSWAITYWISGIALGLCSLIITLRAIVYVQFLCYIGAVLQYFVSLLNYVGSLAYGADGEVLYMSYVMIIVMTAAAMSAALIAFILLKSKSTSGAKIISIEAGRVL